LARYKSRRGERTAYSGAVESIGKGNDLIRNPSKTAQEKKGGERRGMVCTTSSFKKHGASQHPFRTDARETEEKKNAARPRGIEPRSKNRFLVLRERNRLPLPKNKNPIGRGDRSVASNVH